MKKNLQLLIFCLSIFFASTACQTNKVDIKAEVETIRSLSDQWNDAIREKDNSTIMNMFSEEAVFMLDDMPIVKGKEAIREIQESWFSNTAVLHSTFEFADEAIEVSSSGDLAYNRATESIDIITPEGRVEVVSKWVTIWSKIDGEWKAIVVIGNQDNP